MVLARDVSSFESIEKNLQIRLEVLNILKYHNVGYRLKRGLDLKASDRKSGYMSSF